MNKKESENKLKSLIVEYKCLGAYDSAEEMIAYMDNNCETFKSVCNLIRNEDKSFKVAQSIVSNEIKQKIVNIVVDEIYDYV